MEQRNNFFFIEQINSVFDRKQTCEAHVYTRVRNFWFSCFGRGGSMREKTVEQKLVKAVKAAGGICPKWTAPGFDGLPDRMVLLPGGRMGFVEVKAPGKKARPLQESRHELLRSLGYRVYVLDDPGQIGGIIDEIRTA
ncbi:VRR-NUC domain protein [Clostridiales bacterium CHKCI001]|nr:VRR-NUC domain protein [Clostridiales bacterium CHKCI001]